MDNLPSSTEKRSHPGPPSPRQLPISILAAGGILVVVVAAIIIYLGQRGLGGTATATPTPSQQTGATPTPPDSPLPTPSCETVVSSDDVEVSLAHPITVTMGGEEIPVQPFVPQEQAWIYPSGQSDHAVWVCGTVINYVVGLEPTSANEELVGSLTPGDEIGVQMSNGGTLVFQHDEWRETTPGAEDAVAQRQPRLTLVLPTDDRWQIATADYVAAEDSTEPSPAGATGQLGQPVDLGATQVILTEGYLERNADVPPGTAYYLTEFSVENVGEAPLAADSFSIRLRDGVGNTYLLSPQACQAGEFGRLSGTIQPGVTAQGTAGYLVPDPLPAGDLTWIFSLRAGSEEARVRIPRAGEEPDVGEALQPDVTITDAFLSDNRQTLVIEGEVRNRDTAPLIVEPADISLSSSDGTGELVTAAPQLPWTIQAGHSQVIELQYERPDAGSALLEVLGYSFEIGGLE